MNDPLANMKVGETRQGKRLDYIYQDNNGERLYEVFFDGQEHNVYKVSVNRELVGPGFKDLESAQDFVKQDMYPIA
jgi:hypothetical protein